MTAPTCSLPLWDVEPPWWNPADGRPRPWLDWFPHPHGGERPCLMVLPGGGYNMRAPHEGAPVALKAQAAGWHAAVCHYRVQYSEAFRPLGWGPLADAQRAIRLLRSRAESWGIRADRVAVLGFSAGGHLCAMTGVQYRREAPAEDDLAHLPCRPDAIVPCYPVICTEEPVLHAGLIRNLCGEQPSAEERLAFSPERQVDGETPPAFIWHTADDGVVPVANSLRFAEACAAHDVPVEVHVFPHGRHGLGLAEDDPVVGRWWDWCTDWLQRTLGSSP